jgi:hypothetical protein
LEEYSGPNPSEGHGELFGLVGSLFISGKWGDGVLAYWIQAKHFSGRCITPTFQYSNTPVLTTGYSKLSIDVNTQLLI